MTLNGFIMNFAFTRLVTPLQAELHNFWGAWPRCLAGASSFAAAPGGDTPCGRNSLEWNDHSASLRLALRPKNRTLQPVQLRFLG